MLCLVFAKQLDKPLYIYNISQMPNSQTKSFANKKVKYVPMKKITN